MRRTEEVFPRETLDRRYYHPVQKDYATFLKTSAETGGEFTLLEIEVAPGGGNPPHFHKTYDEHFEVLEGMLEVMVDGRTHVLGSGEKAEASRNVLHNRHNPGGETVRFLVTLRPGNEGFEKALKAGYGFASDGLVRANETPKNLYHLAVLLEWSDIGLPGALGIIAPLLRLLAKRARSKGVDRELEARYCR